MPKGEKPTTEIMKTDPVDIVKIDGAQPISLLQMVDVGGLIAKALEKESPLEVIEKLMAMQEKMEAKAAKVAYYAALAKFQAACPAVLKTQEAKYQNQTQYHFAPLSVIIDTVKSALHDCGLSFTIDIEQSSTVVKAICVTHHTLGHSERSSFEVPVDTSDTFIKKAAHRIAAAQSYAKRYALCNAFGIVTADEDNDARTAAPAGGQERKTVTMPQETTELVTLEVEGKVTKILTQNGEKDGKPWERYGIVIDGQAYGTFSKSKRDQAQAAIKPEIPVKLIYTDNGSFTTITEITVFDNAPAGQGDNIPFEEREPGKEEQQTLMPKESVADKREKFSPPIMSAEEFDERAAIAMEPLDGLECTKFEVEYRDKNKIDRKGPIPSALYPDYISALETYAENFRKHGRSK